MALLGTNQIAGHVWPGQLEVYRIDAPAEEWIVDPTLPVLSYDPRFDSDGIVIGRGRLVGPKATATANASGVTTSQIGAEHKTVLTVADGVNVAPVGYAPYNVFKAWSEKAQGVQPIMARNQAIAVPYIEAVSNSGVTADQSNSAYGALTQGDKVTSYYGCAQAGTYADPRFKGMVVKWVPLKVYSAAVTAADSKITLAGAVYSGIKPRIILMTDAAGAPLALPAADAYAYNTTSKAWEATISGSPAWVVYEFGQTADMIAGEVYGIETLTDLPGYLKWVRDNFGAWSMPYGNLTFPLNIPSTAVTRTGSSGDDMVYAYGNGAFALEVASGAAKEIKIDGSKAITVKVADGVQYVDATSGATVTASGTDGWTTLPAADFPTADFTMGKNYTVNPVTGVIQLFGVYDTDGSALTTGDEAKIKVTFYKETSYRPTPDYAAGQVGLTDGRGGSGVVGTEPQFDVAGSIGILRVAIH